MGLVVVLAGTLLALLHTDFGRDRARRLAEGELSALVRGEVTIGRLEGSVLGDLALGDIVLADARGEEVIAIGEIEVAYDVFALMDRTFRAERIEITAPRIRAAQDESGALNLANLLKEEEPADEERAAEPGAPWNVLIDELVVKEGRISLQRAGGDPITVSGLDADVGIELRGAEAGIDLRTIAARWEERELSATVRGAQIQLGEDGYSIEGARAELGRSSVEIRELALDAEGGRVAADLEARVHPAEAAKWLPAAGLETPLDLTFTAARDPSEEPIRVALEIDARGAPIRLEGEVSPETPSADLGLTAEEVQLGEVSARAPAGTISADLSLRARGRELESLRAAVKGTVSGRVAGAALDRLFVDARLRGGTATAAVEAEAPGARAEASARVDLLADPPVVEEARIEGRVPALEALFPGIDRPAPLAGAVGIDLSAKGPITALSAEGEARATSLRLPDASVEWARIDFEASGLPRDPAGRAEVIARGVTAAGQPVGRVWLEAQTRYPAEEIRVELSTGTGTEPYRARGALRISRRPEETAVDIERLIVHTRGVRWRAGGRVVAGKDGSIAVPALRLSSNAGRVRLKGRSRGAWDRGRIALDVEGRGMDLARLRRIGGLEDPPLEGRLDFELEATRRGRRLTAELSGRGRSLLLRPGAPRLEARFGARLRGRRASADARVDAGAAGGAEISLAARAPADALDGRAWAALGRGALRSARLELNELDLEAAARLAGQPGRVSGALDGTAELGRGGETAEVELAARELAVDGQPGPWDLDLDATLSRERLEARVGADAGWLQADFEARIAKPPPVLEPDRWAALDASRVLGVGARVRAPDLDALASALDAPAIEGIAGSASAELRGAGGLEDVELAADLEGLDLGKGSRPVDLSLDGRADLSGAPLTTDVFVELDGRRIARAELRLAAGLSALRARGLQALAGASARGGVEVRDLPIERVAGALAPGRELRGRLSAEASLTGTLRAPVLETRAKIDGARLEGVRLERIDASGSYRDGSVSAELEADQRGGGSLAFEGRLGAGEPRRVRAELAARDFDLAALTPLLPGRGPIADFGGRLAARAEVTGTLEAPRARGRVRLSQGNLRLADPSIQPLEEVELELRMDRGSFSLDASARSGGGALEVSARMAASGLSLGALEASIRARDYPVVAGTRVVRMDLEAAVEAKRRGDLLRGRTEVRSATVRLPDEEVRDLHAVEDLPGDIVFVGEGGAPPEVGEPDGSSAGAGGDAAPLTVRMALSAPETIRVRGEQARALLSADLDATWVGGRTSLTGTVRVVRGWVSILDKRYDIDEANLAFSGSMPPNPQVDVRLGRDFETVRVFILVSGSLEDPEIAFRSEPPRYDEATLLAFVLGRGPTESEPGPSPTVEDRAVGVASGFLLGRVQESLKDVVPIDVLRVEDSDRQGERSQRVTVGKWLTEDLFVAYRFRSASDEIENTNEAEIEYRLGRRWFLEGRYGDAGKGGMDVLWIKRY